MDLVEVYADFPVACVGRYGLAEEGGVEPLKEGMDKGPVSLI